MFAQLLGAATQLSATTDEGFHITSGYEYLRTGHVRLLDEHTPLVKALFAWPLLFVPDLPALEQAPGWTAGDLNRVAQETVLAYRPIDRVIVPPRIAVALLTVLLAASVYRWAANAFGQDPRSRGRGAGLLALTLFTFDPNLLAHGSLATTDMGAVAFIFWAVWAFWSYLQRPTRRRWWAAALLLGLAQGAKLTAALLLPVLAVLLLADAWARGERHAKTWLWRLLSFGGMVLAAALVVWALYLFEVRTLPDGWGGAPAPPSVRLRLTPKALLGRWLPLPAASHVERWLRLQEHVSGGREAFLLGQNHKLGWPQYFPIAFVLKTPLPTLLFFLLTLGALLLGRRRSLTSELTLWLFPIVYSALSLTSTINIGYRHLLPILPFLFVSTARLSSPKSARVAALVPPAGAERKGSGGGRFSLRFSSCVLLLWLGVGTVRLHPHYLTYFNPIAGGPDQGYRFLADSNTDWGQTLKTLAAYQKRHNLGPVRLSQFTFLDPAAYGVDYEPIAPMPGAPPVLPRRFNPAPGLYAISATTLDGVPLPYPATFDWFRHREPLEKVGHAMFLYEVVESQGNWIAQCTLPVAPLTPQAIAEGFGKEALRRVYFDCENSWIWPGGGQTPGWYARATPGIDELRWPTRGERLQWWPDWLAGLPMAPLRLSYVQPTPGELPSFAIWEWAGETIAPPASLLQGPLNFEGTLTFLGYQAPAAARPGASVDVLTFWRVTHPISRPLSLMLHLSGADGLPIAVGDGLGVPVDQWAAGDLILQRHRLNIPADAPPGVYRVRTGAYWLDDLSHLTADGQIYFLLTSLSITP